MTATLIVSVTLAACAPRNVRHGRAALARGDFATATRRLEQAAEADPSNPDRWRELAKAHLLADSPARARHAFERLATLLPHDPHPIVEIGFTYELQRRYDLALTTYLRAIDRAPSNAYPHRVTGTRLLRWGQSTEALPHLQRAVELDVAHAETWKALAMAHYHDSHLDEAERAFRTGQRHHPDHLGLRLGLAALLVNTGRHREALAAYDGVLTRAPRFAAAHVGRAILLHELGRQREAEAAFVRAVEVAEEPRQYQQRLEAYRELIRRP